MLINPYVFELQPRWLEIGRGISQIIHTPIAGSYNFSQCGMIFHKDQLGPIEGRRVTAISLFLSGFEPYFVTNQTVRVAHTTADEFPTGIDVYFSDIPVGDQIAVKDDFSIEMKDGWLRVDIDFIYNGRDNILIAWENRMGNWEPRFGFLDGTDKERCLTTVWRADHCYPDGTASNYLYAQPNIIFHYI